MTDKITTIDFPWELPRIDDIPCSCSCGWAGHIMDCEPDVDGEGSPGCPRCGKVAEQHTPSIADGWAAYALLKRWVQWSGECWENEDQYGRVYCFFCGEPEPKHAENCIYLDIMKLFYEEQPDGE